MALTVSIDTVKVKRLIVYQSLTSADNAGMDMYKYRRDKLLELIDREYGGERVRFCDKTGVSESRLAQILSPSFREGTAFTEKTARKLEGLAQLPAMYFDQGAAPGQLATVQEAPNEALMTLVRTDELRLLDLYRRADKRGRYIIMGVAADEAAGSANDAGRDQAQL